MANEGQYYNLGGKTLLPEKRSRRNNAVSLSENLPPSIIFKHHVGGKVVKHEGSILISEIRIQSCGYTEDKYYSDNGEDALI